MKFVDKNNFSNKNKNIDGDNLKEFIPPFFIDEATKFATKYSEFHTLMKNWQFVLV